MAEHRAREAVARGRARANADAELFTISSDAASARRTPNMFHLVAFCGMVCSEKAIDRIEHRSFERFTAGTRLLKGWPRSW